MLENAGCKDVTINDSNARLAKESMKWEQLEWVEC